MTKRSTRIQLELAEYYKMTKLASESLGMTMAAFIRMCLHRGLQDILMFHEEQLTRTLENEITRFLRGKKLSEKKIRRPRRSKKSALREISLWNDFRTPTHHESLEVTNFSESTTKKSTISFGELSFNYHSNWNQISEGLLGLSTTYSYEESHSLLNTYLAENYSRLISDKKSIYTTLTDLRNAIEETYRIKLNILVFNRHMLYDLISIRLSLQNAPTFAWSPSTEYQSERYTYLNSLTVEARKKSLEGIKTSLISSYQKYRMTRKKLTLEFLKVKNTPTIWNNPFQLQKYLAEIRPAYTSNKKSIFRHNRQSDTHGSGIKYSDNVLDSINPKNILKISNILGDSRPT